MKADFNVPGRDRVIFRHSITGETKSVHIGGNLPDRAKGTWEILFRDNARKEDVILLFVKRGLLFCFETDALPKGDQKFNFLQPCQKHGFEPSTGLYSLVGVSSMMWQGKEQFLVEVERIGDIDLRRRLHPLALLTI